MASNSLSGYRIVQQMSGAGQWKLIHYVGFELELFDLSDDPEKLGNLEQAPEYKTVLEDITQALHAICDPEAADAQAHQDQADMIAGYGGRNAALKLGANAATPPPEIKP